MNEEGYVSVDSDSVTVVLNTQLTDELIAEGFVREFVSKVQTMRKDADFEVMNHILLSVSGSERIENILKANSDSIMKDTLANSFITGQADGIVREWELNGEAVEIGIIKAED